MKRILLVEDEDDLRAMFEFVLRDAGYEVEAVRTASAACEYLRSRAYDLLLTDWNLGSLGSGVTVADDAVKKGTKAIIVSGNSLAIAEKDRARHTVMAKPVRPTQLVDVIEREIGPAARPN
jgi:two-component system response regulator GlrR